MKLTTIVSTTMNSQLEVHATLPKNTYARIGIIRQQKPKLAILASYDPENEQDPQNEFRKGEFLVCSAGAIRPLLKEIKDAQVFTDTGRRVCLNHRWCEIWALRPEHRTLLEKEHNHDNEARSENQSED